MPQPRPNETPVSRHHSFQTTNWSIVLAASGDPTGSSRQALSQLCETYWYPLYAYARRQGHGTADAQDLTQGFFTRLLEKDDLRDVHPKRGRFRSFLLAAMKHYLINHWKRERSAKRGGGRPTLSLDFGSAATRYDMEPVHAQTAEALFERQWALSILDKVQVTLEQKYEEDGKSEMFATLRIYLAGKEKATPYRHAAEKLGMSQGAVKVAIHRMRRRFGDLLRAEVLKTVEHERDVDDEIRLLLNSLKTPAT